MATITNDLINEYQFKYFIDDKSKFIRIMTNYIEKVANTQGKYNKIIVVGYLLVCLIANFQHLQDSIKFIKISRTKMDEFITDLSKLKDNLNDYPESQHDDIINKCNKCIELCQFYLHITSSIEI